ncbi:Nucleotide-binding universal stress protein, UspA family [Halopelagius inordinatus]|uniref:Nucleotide-binding universal stress protein, UspA family n=1 Tax=Halopelagius inordinatus TaxID=553467 RepID=A0A1I2P531_9EURY|nr:universal stress protein [Halopelagius inordinatus]SFG11292.1 Nucleotide-binding universal stress protein, UspA family [Halopelagius inordinatus]
MTERDWTVLVPLEVLEGQTIPDTVVELLSPFSVVLLGYHILPEQTAPGQARIQFEEKAQSLLDELAAEFRETGGSCETRLVFTHDEEQTLDRVADEAGCTAILVPNPTTRVERVLVPVGDDVNVARVAAFVAAMADGRDVELTLYHVADDEEAEPAGRSIVEDAAARLRENGLASDAVRTEVVVSKTPVRAIADAADDHDVVVMGESEPSLRSFLFGEISDQVAARSLGPVIVVRRRRDSAAPE